jgi:hypothetical protein
MTPHLVGDGVGEGGLAGHGPTWWVNHRFLPADATVMSDGSILRYPFHDHVALCGSEFGALNGALSSKPACAECDQIAVRMGAR